MSESAEMGQRFAPVLESPLHYVRARHRNPAAAAVTLSERSACILLNLRGSPENEPFRESVRAVLHVELPEVGRSADSELASIYWLGPDEWLAVVDQATLAEPVAALRGAIQGHVSIVDVSSAQSLLAVQGAGVAELLQKASVYDFHPREFGPGRCAQTTFAKATALVRCVGEEHFELIVRRSFIDYVARWIVDACAESGCHISGT